MVSFNPHLFWARSMGFSREDKHRVPMTNYKSRAAFVDDALGAIATYGTADYVENRGSEHFLRLMACLKNIGSKILFPILKKAVADDGTFDPGTAASVDEEYYATGEDLFLLFVA